MTTQHDAALKETQAILDMLALCGEPEVRNLPGYATAEKLRALIDGLITQRQRADQAEAGLRSCQAFIAWSRSR